MEQLAVMFQTLQGAPMGAERRDPEAHRTNVLMEFMKLKPPMFEGSSEDVTAERWLREVKEKFDTLGVPQEYRVGFATYLFEGSVEEWWDLHMDDYDVLNLMWDKFETLFREKYVHGTQIGQLVQGGMTVAEYHARFVELSDCDPTFMADPILRCMKFKEGLRPQIRSKLAPLPMTDFSVLVAAALLTEADLIQNIGNKGSEDHNKKIGKKDKVRGLYKLSSSRRYEPYPCTHCKQSGHVRRNCPHRSLSNNEKRRERRRERRRRMLNSLDALNFQTQPAPDQNLSGDRKNQLHGQSSNKITEYDEKVCHYCRQDGHIKRNCPDWLKQSSQVGVASSGAQNCERQPTLDQNLSDRKKDWLQGKSSQTSETKEGSHSQCHRCGQTGHKRRNCPNRQQKLPLASGGQQKSKLGPTSGTNQNILSTPFTSTSQPPGLIPHYYHQMPTPVLVLQGQSSQGGEDNGNICNYCRQEGHSKQNCPNRQQKSPLASEGQQKSEYGPTSSALNSQTQPVPNNNTSTSFTSTLQPPGLLPQYDPQMLPPVSVLQGQSSQGSKTKESSGVFCHRCRQGGHLRRTCPNKQQKSPLAPGVQQNSEFGPTSSSVINSQTPLTFFATTTQPPGLLPRYYPHTLPHVFGQSGSTSSGLDNSQTQLAPYNNQSFGKKDPSQGWNGRRLLPTTCHICHQIGHLKRDCPYEGQPQSPLVLGGQQWSQFDLAS